MKLGRAFAILVLLASVSCARTGNIGKVTFRPLVCLPNALTSASQLFIGSTSDIDYLIITKPSGQQMRVDGSALSGGPVWARRLLNTGTHGYQASVAGVHAAATGSNTNNELVFTAGGTYSIRTILGGGMTEAMCIVSFNP